MDNKNNNFLIKVQNFFRNKFLPLLFRGILLLLIFAMISTLIMATFSFLAINPPIFVVILMAIAVFVISVLFENGLHNEDIEKQHQIRRQLEIIPSEELKNERNLYRQPVKENDYYYISNMSLSDFHEKIMNEVGLDENPVDLLFSNFPPEILVDDKELKASLEKKIKGDQKAFKVMKDEIKFKSPFKIVKNPKNQSVTIKLNKQLPEEYHVKFNQLLSEATRIKPQGINLQR